MPTTSFSFLIQRAYTRTKYKKKIQVSHKNLPPFSALASRCGQQQTTQALLHSSNLILPRNVVFFFSSYPTLQAPSPSPVTSTLHLTFFLLLLAWFCFVLPWQSAIPPQNKQKEATQTLRRNLPPWPWLDRASLQFVSFQSFFVFRGHAGAGMQAVPSVFARLLSSPFPPTPWSLDAFVEVWGFGIFRFQKSIQNPFRVPQGTRGKGGAALAHSLTHSLTLALSLSFVHQGMLCVLLLLLLADLQFVSKSFP